MYLLSLLSVIEARGQHRFSHSFLLEWGISYLSFRAVENRTSPLKYKRIFLFFGCFLLKRVVLKPNNLGASNVNS